MAYSWNPQRVRWIQGWLWVWSCLRREQFNSEVLSLPAVSHFGNSIHVRKRRANEVEYALTEKLPYARCEVQHTIENESKESLESWIFSRADLLGNDILFHSGWIYFVRQTSCQILRILSVCFSPLLQLGWRQVAEIERYDPGEEATFASKAGGSLMTTLSTS